MPGFYLDLPTIPGAVDAFNKLSEKYEVYILTAPSWENPSCYTDKRLWVEKYLGDVAYKRLIISNDDYAKDKHPHLIETDENILYLDETSFPKNGKIFNYDLDVKTGNLILLIEFYDNAMYINNKKHSLKNNRASIDYIEKHSNIMLNKDHIKCLRDHTNAFYIPSIDNQHVFINNNNVIACSFNTQNYYKFCFYV